MQKINYYASVPLDRAFEQRRDSQWLEDRLQAPESRLVPVYRSLNYVTRDSEEPRAVMIPAAEPWWRGRGKVEIALLGVANDIAVFAGDFSEIDHPDKVPQLVERGAFADLRMIGALLPHNESGLLAYARGLMSWHRRHRHCGVCGHATKNADGGHMRVCNSERCRATFAPRSDPGVVILLQDPERCMLARSPKLPAGVYAPLSGMPEPGESLEDAVIRIVAEETGAKAKEIHYHSSQPWPFPNALMVGFYVQVQSSGLRINPNRLEDARWFDREWLLSVSDLGWFRLPRP
ncbi:MAG: NAD(+) diphosphatase, partial [Pseudomonadota bacterium]|nr:NAD(+) diphosphatase [Pseudomonadota bacterium]